MASRMESSVNQEEVSPEPEEQLFEIHGKGQLAYHMPLKSCAYSSLREIFPREIDGWIPGRF